MTWSQLALFNLIYLAATVVVAVLTRATWRRIGGALAGGTAFGVVALGMIAVGERAGWWHMAIDREPSYLAMLLVDFALCAFVPLITWRIARRFGGRGLAATAALLAIIGPPRDYWYLRHFPEWGHYNPGMAPVVAISATYVLLLVVGHGVMRLEAGPSRGDRLARRPWEAGSPPSPGPVA